MTEMLMNIWYMGAWAYEVSEKPMSRRLLGKTMVFFRNRDGEVISLRDRCPHRFAPLSRGTVIDDHIQCPYHGLVFNAAGQCVANPLDDNAPAAARVQSFPVVEQDGIVWFWPGDPDQRDRSMIPDFSYLLDTQTFRHVFGCTQIKSHFELETDNLMDLSHVTMLHPMFFNLLDANSKYKAKRDGNTVHSNWFTEHGNNCPIYEYGLFPTKGAPVDAWLEMRWNAPAAMYLVNAVTRSGEPRSAGYTAPATHILTPETETTTHYFWSGSLRAEDPVPLEVFREGLVAAFDREDKPMVELVSREMGDKVDLLTMAPLLLRSDGGAVLARRALAEMRASEAKMRASERAAAAA